MKTVLSIIVLGLLVALCCSAQPTIPPDQIPTLSCSDVCNALNLTGWLWLNCFAVCQGYILLTDVHSLPPSLKENPFFLKPCQREQLISKPDLYIAARAVNRIQV